MYRQRATTALARLAWFEEARSDYMETITVDSGGVADYELVQTIFMHVIVANITVLAAVEVIPSCGRVPVIGV